MFLNLLNASKIGKLENSVFHFVSLSAKGYKQAFPERLVSGRWMLTSCGIRSCVKQSIRNDRSECFPTARQHTVRLLWEVWTPIPWIPTSRNVGRDRNRSDTNPLYSWFKTNLSTFSLPIFTKEKNPIALKSVQWHVYKKRKSRCKNIFSTLRNDVISKCLLYMHRYTGSFVYLNGLNLYTSFCTLDVFAITFARDSRLKGCLFRYCDFTLFVNTQNCTHENYFLVQNETV